MVAARCPPGRIYGAAALVSSSHLLESLAAAAAAATLVLKSSTWTEAGGTLNLILNAFARSLLVSVLQTGL